MAEAETVTVDYRCEGVSTAAYPRVVICHDFNLVAVKLGYDIVSGFFLRSRFSLRTAAVRRVYRSRDLTSSDWPVRGIPTSPQGKQSQYG
jgi:hypothetical protein